MTVVTKEGIANGFKALGIMGERVLIHSSLSSFGHVSGGAETVLDVILSSFKTVMMPAFCWDSNVSPPKEDRPPCNGCDYKFYDSWDRPIKPFIIESAGIEKSMGIISRRFLSVPGVRRSDHAWHSWAAYGDMVGILVDNHGWDTANLPVERFSEMGGYMLLLGTGLRSCTAIHIAEERAGRRPFIRWAADRHGLVRRVMAAGCGKGFDNLMPYCSDLFMETHIGKCRALATRLKPFIERVTSVILSNPEATRCSPTCIRCRDAIAQAADVGHEVCL